jgi:hypothetical protein
MAESNQAALQQVRQAVLYLLDFMAESNRTRCACKNNLFYTYWILWLNPTEKHSHPHSHRFYTYWILWLNPTEC